MARDTLNDSKWITHIQKLLLYLGHWEKFHFFSFWILTWDVYNLINFLFTVPSLPPTNVSAHNTSSTSLHVSWHEVPKGFVHGILLGYRVLYKIANVTGNKSITTTSETINKRELQELKKFTIYEINVLAFTAIGDGANSKSIHVSTDEDGKRLIWLL